MAVNIPFSNSNSVTENRIKNRMNLTTIRVHRGHDRMVVGFTTTCAINAYHQQSREFDPCSWRGVLDTTVCDKVCQ